MFFPWKDRDLNIITILLFLHIQTILQVTANYATLLRLHDITLQLWNINLPRDCGRKLAFGYNLAYLHVNVQ